MALLELTHVTAGYGAAPDILNGISLRLDAACRNGDVRG
jgi:hypothetical protein